MEESFFSKSPEGHTIRSISKSAATSRIRAEALVVPVPNNIVDGLRRRCAAVVWVSSDVYSVDAITKLKPRECAFLLNLFGLQGGGTLKAQARRIDDHFRRVRHGATSRKTMVAGQAIIVGAAEAPPASGTAASLEPSSPPHKETSSLRCLVRISPRCRRAGCRQ